MTRPNRETGDVMVTEALPLLPSLLAGMVVGPPTATPVAPPKLSTLAMAELLEDQVTWRPLRTLPPASFRTAWNVVDTPTGGVAVPLTVMVAIGGPVTLSWAVPVTNSMVAEMVTGPPTRFAVTRPVWFTEATDGSLDDQFTGRPVRTLPASSFGVAVSWVVAWSAMLAAPLTVTVATGTLLTVTWTEPLLPPLLAVTVVVPTETPVIEPSSVVPDTVAIAGLLEVQVTGFPESTRLPAS